MDISEFTSRLELYIDKKINYKIFDNVLKVYMNNEIYYNFDCGNMKADIYERNIKTEIGSWNDEKVAKVNFAMLIRNAFKTNNDTLPYELDECDSLEKLSLVVEKYIDKKYYSIGSSQIGKISIILDNDYEILYRTANQKHIICKDTDEKYIFGRFYYEVTYFDSFMKDLKVYEIIFNETFSEEEIVHLIRY